MRIITRLDRPAGTPITSAKLAALRFAPAAYSIEALDEAVEQVSAAPSRMESFDVFCSWIPLDRFPFVSCVEFLEEAHVVATNFPKSWEEEYRIGQYDLYDPVNLLVGRQSSAFNWSDAKAFARYLGARTRSARIMRAAMDHKLVDGYVIPFHGPFNYRSCISLAGPADATGLPSVAMTFLESLATSVQIRMSEFHFEKASTGTGPKLTEREISCLNLVGLGKTDSDIATILGIARSTAHEYVNNAITKLDATNRTHAFAKAVARGLITPRP